MSSTRYIGPVVLWDEKEEADKTRKVEIYKNEVFKDIDLYTHKHVDAREDMGNRSANAVSSDNSENVDGAVIARYVEFRNAQLRYLLQFCLLETTEEYADDDITLEDNKYTYVFTVPDGFNDNTLRPLAEHIHRFLVWGALYDWYSQFGMAQAAVYDTKDLLENIVGTLRSKSTVKRPLQPFGPAKKIH